MSLSSPSQPDPVATATAQANINHVNQDTPYGDLTYSQTGTNSDGTPQYTSNISLTPVGQSIFTQQQQQQQDLSNVGNSYMSQIQNAMGQPLNTSNIPAIQSTASSGGIPLDTGVSSGPIQSQLNTQGIVPIPGGNNFSQNAQQYQQAYDERMQPQLQVEQNALNTQLANQGITPGSAAYNQAQTLFGYQENDANAQGVMGGYQTQEALNAQQLAANQAGMSNAEAQGNFANSAQQQGFTEGMTNAQLNNQANQQAYGENLSNAQLGNSANAQALSEAITQQELPLNEYNALASASQVQAPTFQAEPQNNNLSQMAQNNYNQQVGTYNSTLSGLFGLGGAGASAYFGG